MTIERLDLKQWEEIISREGETLPFLRGEFLSCLSNYTKAKMELLGFYQGAQLIGYMPAFYTNIGPLHSIFSPPYNSAIPFLGYSLTKDYFSLKQNKKEGILKTIASDLWGVIQNNRIQFAYIDLDSQKADIRPFLWQGFNVKPSYDYVISLEREEKDIWNSFKKGARNDVSLAERRGITVGKENNAHHFWGLEESRYHEQQLKLPIYGENYVQSLVTKFPSTIHLYYAYDSSGVIIGTVIMFTRERNAYLWLGITSSEGSTQANELLIWELLKLYRKDGYKQFIIIGANKENLCEFKSKFNPTPAIRFAVIHETVLGKAMSITYRKIVKRL